MKKIILYVYALFFLTLSQSLAVNAWSGSATTWTKSLRVLAGNYGGSGSLDGPGNIARFGAPYCLDVDSAGNIFVTDRQNHTIRKMDANGVVSTIAGLSGVAGTVDGTGSAARFNNPLGIAVDGAGNIYVTEISSYVIRKITPAGVVTTLAGSAGVSGSADGTGSAARFFSPAGIAVNTAGTVIYVSDSTNNTVRKITAAGVVTTLAGTAGASGSTDATGAAARFNAPIGLAMDTSDNAYVADRINQTIRKITPAGVVTTLAGLAGSSGSADGTGSAARFSAPYSLTVDSSGIVYVADSNNHTLRAITPSGVVTTIAGTAGSAGSVDGTGSAMRLNSPTDVAINSSGTLYVVETGNYQIRKITAGVLKTIAGTPMSMTSTDGTGRAAGFSSPAGIAVSASGTVYVADTNNNTVRAVSPAGVVTTLAGLAGSAGSTNGTGSAARFSAPSGIAVDSLGNIFVSEKGNSDIRKITPAGVVTTFAGTTGSSGIVDGNGTAAKFNYPTGLAIDSSDNLYTVDRNAQTIRKITPAGDVTTFAGTASSAGSADGTGSAARFNFPTGGVPITPISLSIDSSGNLYVPDGNNFTIRKITPAQVVTTIAGQVGVSGTTDGLAAAARFVLPIATAVDRAGNIYVLDRTNKVVRKITSAGVVTTVIGTNANYGVKLGALPASLNTPFAIAVRGGKLYILTENSVLWTPQP